jgi:hypothetical protein
MANLKNIRPKWSYLLPWDDLLEAARNHIVPIPLFASIVMVESYGVPTVKRFEPHFKYFEKPEYFAKLLEIPIEEEVKNQATSWGCCQLMGTVLREMGFDKKLELALDVKTNLDFGAKKIASILKRWPFWFEAASAYNHGEPWRTSRPGYFQNDKYVGRVRFYIRSFCVEDPHVLCGLDFPDKI